MNIPIYRAKKIDGDEYVKGCLVKQGIEHFISLGIWSKEESKSFHHFDLYKLELIKIDTTTLAIHFPDMIDSQGNKIFASLQEDGKGGDMLNLDERCGENFNAIALYRYYEIHLKGGVDLLNRAKYLRCYPKKDIKVVGVQE